VAHVEQPGGLVCALEVPGGLREIPALVADDRGIRQALELERAGFDLAEEVLRAVAPQIAGGGGVEEQIQAIELLPDLDGELIAHRPRILPRLID